MRSSWPKTRQVIEKLTHTAKWKCGKVKFFAGVAFRTKNGFLQLGHLTLSRPWINNLTSQYWFGCTSCSSSLSQVEPFRCQMFYVYSCCMTCCPLFLPWGLHCDLGCSFHYCVANSLPLATHDQSFDLLMTHLSHNASFGLTFSFKTLSVHLMFTIRLKDQFG